MVCDRCKTAVRGELDKAGVGYSSLELGEVELTEPVAAGALEKFRNGIEPLGFELIEDKPAREVNQIKQAALDWARGSDGKNRKMKFSAFLSDRMHRDYATLSNLFSSVEGTTIEQFVIHQKIELVKELLVYNELTLSEIAVRLGYSSVQHLSNQFKKVTGLTPSHFKQIGALKRQTIDRV